jgi:hypothetical protein
VTPTTSVTPTAPGSGPEPVPPQPKEICDGSDAVRFLSNTDGGFVDQYYAFMEYGHQLLAIDGHCNYWVTAAADGQVRTGVVTEAEAQDLVLQANYGNWGMFNGYVGDFCSDGAGTVLWDSEEVLLCACSCNGEGAPPGYPEAFVAARTLSTELYSMGEPSTDALQLLVVAAGADSFQDEGVAWPLEWDPATVAIEDQQTFAITAESGMRVTDAEQCAALRRMRVEYATQGGPANYNAVHAVSAANDGGVAQHYLVFTRDDVPASVRAARVAAHTAESKSQTGAQ